MSVVNNYVFLLDKKGSGSKKEWDFLQGWRPRDGAVWLDLNYDCEDTKQWLTESSELDEHVVEALISEETRPRCIAEKSGVLLILRGINFNAGEDADDLVSIRIWLEKNRIITVHRRNLLSIAKLHSNLNKSNGPSSPDELLVELVDGITDYLGETVDDLSDKIDVLENQVIENEYYDDRTDILSYRRSIISLRRHMHPQREALLRLQSIHSKYIDDDCMTQIREVCEHMTRCVEAIDSAKDHAIVVHEELTGRISEKIEKRMYLLSIIAGIFLPLTFVTGLLGINVEGIPGAKNEHAFLYVVAGLVFVGVIMLAWLRRRRWIDKTQI